ncbi:UDP-N-acetylglucosamine 2-epimerase [Aquimarina agarilytica]|uniref:UDP-N-acetylglucosamine 2-epimerase n=1 Tax=Aquimarina agarilytica TaxID=1087449 RepID=UPI0002887607|nr:UDP-N-acetylglucosamine 2-epimerase [Aquimarina agarilytica]
MTRKITIVTGTRAEYGLLKPLIKSIFLDAKLELQLIVTGMHLSNEFGYTIREIENDGFPIVSKIECLLSSDSSVGVSKSIAIAISGFADAFENLKPEILVVLGDRTEILAAVIAATSANIPIAHLHGGETTEGAYDEGIRHSITKFSHLHFTSTEIYKKRVIQLGESPNNVFDVGAIGLDSIKGLDLYSKQEFEKSIKKGLKKKNCLITYHPVTLEIENPMHTFTNILRALDEYDDTLLIFTHANSDKNGRIINTMIEDYVKKNEQKAVSFKSLGQMRYLSALKYVDVVVGNSSSGIIEVPYFNIPTINIGDRQKGRISPLSVLDVNNSYEEIKLALKKSFSLEFKNKIEAQDQVYGSGNTTQKIINILKGIDSFNLKKQFYNIDFEY